LVLPSFPRATLPLPGPVRLPLPGPVRLPGPVLVPGLASGLVLVPGLASASTRIKMRLP